MTGPGGDIVGVLNSIGVAVDQREVGDQWNQGRSVDAGPDADTQTKNQSHQGSDGELENTGRSVSHNNLLMMHPGERSPALLGKNFQN